MKNSKLTCKSDIQSNLVILVASVPILPLQKAPSRPEIEILPPQILRPALFQCFVCNVKLRTLLDFKNHFQAQHKINATSRSQRYTCGFCKSKFPKQNLFTHHMIGEHLEDRYSLVEDLQPKEFLNLSKISKQLRREPDQDLELLKAIETLERSIENEDDDDVTDKSAKDDTLGMIDTQTVKQVKYLMISNRKGDLFEFSCGFCQDKFLDMKKFMLHAEKFHLKSN